MRSLYESLLDDEEDLLNLISPKAEEHLEEMARKANELTNRYFGKAVLLYTFQLFPDPLHLHKGSHL